jgi:hypothetical protein
MRLAKGGKPKHFAYCIAPHKQSVFIFFLSKQKEVQKNFGLLSFQYIFTIYVYFTISISSTSKINNDPGGICPAGKLPYPKSLGI